MITGGHADACKDCMHEHICSMVHTPQGKMGIEEETQTPAHLCREIQDQLATAEGVCLPVGVGGVEQSSSKVL